jgi:hypothetical protein
MRNNKKRNKEKKFRRIACQNLRKITRISASNKKKEELKTVSPFLLRIFGSTPSYL